MTVNPFAGKPAEPAMLVNLPKLITAYYTEVPDPHVPDQRVMFGTSGHRGSAFEKAFNEWHILAIIQAICLYRSAALFGMGNSEDHDVRRLRNVCDNVKIGEK